jgi:hypothetical protein
MKVARVGIIATVVLAVATVAWAQKPDFSGTWTLDPAASDQPAGGGGGGGGGGRGGGRGGILGMGPTAVKQSATELAVEVTGQDGTKATRTYKLDGTESKNTITTGRGTMESVSTAKFDGPKLTIVTKQSMGDQTFETTENWTVSGSTLTVESTSARGTTKRVYKK